MKKELIKRMKNWCKDYEQITGLCSEPDCDTLEGDAYSIFQNLLANRKQTEKELDIFLKTVCEGIRGEYEKGWSHRKFSEDQKKMRKILYLFFEKDLRKNQKELKKIVFE